MIGAVQPVNSLIRLDLILIFSDNFRVFAALAQLVERLTRNEKVAGSIPAGGSIFPRPSCH